MASEYHLAPPVLARLVGLALVALAVLVFVTTLVGVLAAWSPAVTAAVGLAGLIAVFTYAGWLRRAVVVRLDAEGYRVRLVRGAGVTAAAWPTVEDVVSAEVAGDPCVQLRLADGGTTTLPLRALAVAPDDFVTDLRQHPQEGHGLRPL